MMGACASKPQLRKAEADDAAAGPVVEAEALLSKAITEGWMQEKDAAGMLRGLQAKVGRGEATSAQLATAVAKKVGWLEVRAGQRARKRMKPTTTEPTRAQPMAKPDGPEPVGAADQGETGAFQQLVAETSHAAVAAWLSAPGSDVEKALKKSMRTRHAELDQVSHGLQLQSLLRTLIPPISCRTRPRERRSHCGC